MTTINQAEIAAVEATETEGQAVPFTMTATYSPEDNKLRLRSPARLDKALYLRLKEAGFSWAPKQEIFVAPMWTPARADLLIELCGEIGDEDITLVDRAEERAERFDGYRERRADDAAAAISTVKSITDHIPFGQPILVGHHSERRARKEAARIENGMRKAVDLWDTSQYWKRRAAGAVRHAKYKELPAVRHRRIKGLEADKRKQEKRIAEAEDFLTLWKREGLTVEQAKRIANFDYITVQEAGEIHNTSLWSLLTDEKISAENAAKKAIETNANLIQFCTRWLTHIANRIVYERAMLDEQGGDVTEKFNVEIGGRVLIGSEWLVVLRVNKSNGKINSVTTNAKYVRVRGIEEVKDYKAPEAADVQKVKSATKLAPLCNYPGDGFKEMTKAEYDKRHSEGKFIRPVKSTEQHGTHRARFVYSPNDNYRTVQVFITDAKRSDPPAATPTEPVSFERQQEITAPRQVSTATQKTEFDLLRDRLKDGVQVVVAPQLVPTPSVLASRMVVEAEIESGHSVLESSAGTGRILQAIAEVIALDQISVTAIEINFNLAKNLETRFPAVKTICRDFLDHLADNQKFDRILLNPPFADAQDIKHILHAIAMLKSGGRLVAICANGPRQQSQLKPVIESAGGTWEVLPADSFKESGIMVHTALITLEL
jgi:phospholipid N-methyltransferase